MKIDVKIPLGGFEAGTRDLPKIPVKLENVALDGQGIFLKIGNGVCVWRWRIHVWNSSGELLPTVPKRTRTFSYSYSYDTIEFGSAWATRLTLHDFVDIEHSGKYKVQVFYHNLMTIAAITDPTELNDFILIRSDPFELVVKKGPLLYIELSPEQHRGAQAQVKLLNGDDDLRILLCEYGPDYHQFIRPSTPQGRLLTMGDRALPALLEALEDRSLSFRKRAWVLSLLYSITKERGFNPMDIEGILPSYRWRSGTGLANGWERYNRSDPRNVDGQLKLADRWLEFRENYIVVTGTDER